MVMLHGEIHCIYFAFQIPMLPYLNGSVPKIQSQSILVHIPININNHNQETTKVSLDLEAMLKVSYVHIFLKHIIFSAKYSQLF